MPSYNRSFLKEEEKQRFGRRLTHYLEDFTYRHQITHNEAAKMLGISSNKFSQLKSGGEQGRFLSSLDYLKSLADLEGMDLKDFVAYIEGDGSKTSSSSATSKYSWQDKVYKSLGTISISCRKKFSDALLVARKDNDRVELICRIATAVANKKIDAIRSLADALEVI